MKLDLLSELELEHGEDAPMSMAADMQVGRVIMTSCPNSWLGTDKDSGLRSKQ
jgi:hypothetical protein